MEQTIFDMLYPKFKIDKTIKLIEMFGGYGSQFLSLKYINANVEHHKLIEWAAKSIQAYNDIHIQDYTNYSKDLTDDEVIDKLFSLGVSLNYNEPATRDQLKRQNYRKIYNNIIATDNLVNIQQVKGKDLEITDKDKYVYVCSYSFPCQDLSNAGKKAGFNDTSTRSGMLWEVERILDECNELGQLPQVLLMENVIQIHSPGENAKNFFKWQSKLESLGYKNYMQDLIATDYGIPQTRNRCFMVSILGDYSYTFPKPIPLKLKLKDLLEDNVDEKYFISDAMYNYLQSESSGGFSRKESFERIQEKIEKEGIAATLTTNNGQRATDNFIRITKDTENYIEWEEKGKLDIDCRASKEDKVSTTICTTPKNKVLIKNATKKGYLEAEDGDGIDISSRMEYHRGTVQKGKAQTITTQCDNGVLIDTLKRDLCNKLIQNGSVEEGDVVKHSYTTQIMEGNKKCVEKNDGNMITLTTRGDCVGVCVNENNKVINPLKDKSGKSWQFEQQVYDENGSARTLKASEGSGNIPKVVNNNLRIRKLTPRECFRLMGVKDEDFDKVRLNQSDSSLYHLAGDSIVCDVLCHIFKEML